MIFYIQRQRKHKMVQRVHLWYNQISYLPGGQPTNWRKIIPQKYLHKSESFELHIRLPAWGLPWGGVIPRAFSFGGQQDLIRGTRKDWGKQRLHVWRVHTGSHMHQNTGQEQWLHRHLNQIYLLVLEDLQGRKWLAVVLSGDIGDGGHLRVFFWILDILLRLLVPRPGPTQQPVGSSAEMP